MSFTRKHYEAIAAILRDMTLISLSNADQLTGANLARDSVADRLARMFAADNPRFDRSRFLTACGLED